VAKKFRVAVIGSTGRGDYGHGFDTVWPRIPQAEVVAVADDNDAGRAAAIRKTGAKAAYADYRVMLEKERPEVVAIATRWLDQHHAMVLACTEFGCHIVMEKPFCRTLEEADEMVRAIEMRHLKLAIGHLASYSPITDMAKKLVGNGEIGEVLEARARGKEDPRGGGEDFWVLGSHLVNLLRIFLGNPSSCFASVSLEGRPVAKEDVHEGAEGIGPLAGDCVNADYAFGPHRRGYVATQQNRAGRPSRFAVQIFGSKGILEVLTGYLEPAHILKDSSWSPGRSDAKWQPVSSAGIGKPEPITADGHEGGNVATILDLFDAIQSGRQPKCNVYDARWTIEMLAAAFESHRTGRPVQFPLKTRKNPLTLI
jgi:predicted dehydrogenase